MPRYQPASSLESPRFCGVRTFMRLPHVRDTEGVDFAIVGVPFDDATTHRPGARFGPVAVRNMSIMLRPWNPVHDIEIFRYCSGVDYGDSPVVPGYIEDTYQRIEETFLPLYRAGVTPIGIGGDHSITLAELRAAAKAHGPVALVQLDAHLDTLDAYFGRKYNHGTPFRRAAEEGLLDLEHSIQVGIRGSNYGPEDNQRTRDLGFELITGYELADMGVRAAAERIRRRVGDRKAFLTFDIDFVDPAYAPGTGTPEVEGVTSREAMQLVRALDGIRFVGFDLVEVAPAYDAGEMTATLAANLIFEFISLIALAKRRGK